MSSFTRKEDEALLKGRGCFVADHKIPHMLEVAFVRSPYAHARILGFRGETALQSRGAFGVFTADDLPSKARQLPNTGRQPSIHSLTDFTLAYGETRYVGEAVAVVLAENRYLAEDAAELVEIDYEPLAVCSSLESALLPSTPLVHPQFGSNLAGERTWEVGDVDAAFAQADFVLDEKFKVHRGTSNPMEPRGLIALPKAHGGGAFTLEIIASTQSPYRLRDSLADMLQIPAREIWVRSDCVGGGFGPKSGFYAEDFIVAWLAVKTGKPVRWLEDRREHLLCARQERDQIHEVSVAFSKSGRITGLKDKFSCDVGAYSTTVIIPWTTAYTLAGPYKIANLRIHMQLAFTHKVPTMTVRGAGRPEAAFVIERVIDCVAAKLGTDPLEIREVNAVSPKDLPWDTGLTSRDGEKIVYENVDIPGVLKKVAAHLDYRRLRETFPEQNHNTKIRRGVGIASYVVTTGRGPYEVARVRLESDGLVVVYTGACPQGQGHHTSLAQVCAKELGIPIDSVKVVSGDTNMIHEGFGTFASRSAVTAGNAVAAAARAVLQQVKEKMVAAEWSHPDDVRWNRGHFEYAGREIELSEALALLKRLPDGLGLFPLEASARFETKGHTFVAGAHGAVVEVDADAGTIKIIKIVAAHDAGSVINPMIVEGQLHGGVVHGIGNSLLERVAYDENGQMLSSTFKDYLLPLSTDVGDIEVLLCETPTQRNPLGIKGVGESGTVGVAPAVAAAVEHALAGFSVTINSFPINPEELAQWNKKTGGMNHSVIEVANQQLDLRDWLVQVKQLGELVEIEGVHWDKEMGALTQIVHERSSSSPPALLFSKVPGYPDGFRTLYGSLSSVKRLALSLGIPSEYDQKISLLKEFRAKVESIKAIPPRTVSRGPIFANVLEGDRVNVLKFPVPKHHEQDPARFIATACAVILKHPDEGWFNVGTYRSMVYSETEIGLEMSPTSDGGRIQKLYLERNEPMPVAICVGQHPLIYLVGSTKHNLPEYDVAGGILGQPVDVVKGPFTGFPIPANAEIVLEGVVQPNQKKPEGPFGEWMGYYASDVVDRPYVDVKTVLHRDDPILTCAPQHKPPDETVLLRSLATSSKAWQALEGLGVRGVKGVWQHEGGASKKFLVISLEQQFVGHARQALHVAASSAGAIFGGKWVIVVDDDIDPTNMTEVTWALCTRVNGLDDFDFIQKAPSGGLIDPLTGDYFNTHILVDACIPYGQKASGKFPQAVTVSKELTDSLLDRWGMRFKQWFKS